jgi:hypothetical protein
MAGEPPREANPFGVRLKPDIVGIRIAPSSIVSERCLFFGGFFAGGAIHAAEAETADSSGIANPAIGGPCTGG